MLTQFLPSKRVSREVILVQRELLLSKNIIPQILDNVPIGILILNETRQTVYFNKKFIELADKEVKSDLLGLRPGEILGCIHSCLIEGCGTTEFCRYCGAAKAIVSGLNEQRDVQECRILLRTNEAIDLSVYTNTIKVDGELFTSFCVIDISAERRKEVLERIFFHDVLNIASGLKGILEFLPELCSNEKVEMEKLALVFTSVLIDEINSQKMISEAETGELVAEYSIFSLRDLINSLISLFQLQFNAKNITIKTEFIPDEIFINCDKLILRRVIINLIKNAIEASKRDSIVKVSVLQVESKVLIKVYNQSVMPENVKLQIFKRSFSTKGRGRGIGTYSIKMLTELYLNGKVNFISEEVFGTEFIVELPTNMY